MTQIAFLGTGILGSAFVEAALGRGERVTVWNRTPAKAKALETFGARAAATPAEAVRGAERVHLVLVDDATVEEVIAALRPGLAPDAIIIDHTTTLPALTAERSTRLNAEGVHYLHCPVFIGPAAARKAQGSIVVSGPRALYEAVKLALAHQAAHVEYLGERPDLAAVHKLCGNALILGIAALAADVHTIARGAGVAPKDTLRLLDYFDPSPAALGRMRSMATGVSNTHFELTMARKDVRLMIETAGTAPLAALPGIATRMDALIAQGFGSEDLGVIGRDAVR